ncbi:Uncharacterised protein [Mycobacteroides abscessus subsp. abscessus]|nr:Uncharacterised protein [Mycobacteroides abscessus subsp. abscessus]
MVHPEQHSKQHAGDHPGDQAREHAAKYWQTVFFQNFALSIKRIGKGSHSRAKQKVDPFPACHILFIRHMKSCKQGDNNDGRSQDWNEYRIRISLIYGSHHHIDGDGRENHQDCDDKALHAFFSFRLSARFSKNWLIRPAAAIVAIVLTTTMAASTAPVAESRLG